MDRWIPRLMVIGMASLLLLAGILAPRVRSASHTSGDVLTQVLGGASEIAAESAFQRADVYFHAGVRDESDRAGAAMVFADLPLMRLVQQLQETTIPKEERHLQGKDEKELLPWFDAAVRLNPHYIEAWAVGTYWYYRIGENGLAEAFISEGIRRNPREYKLYLERGVLFVRLGQPRRALSDLEKARTLRPPGSKDPEWRAVDTYLYYVNAKLAGDPRLPDLFGEKPALRCPRGHTCQEQ